ncbi:MAG: DUF3072 domain-containing protein [Pseudomonadota bacterium]
MLQSYQVVSENLASDRKIDEDKPMTEVQAAKLRELCDELGEDYDAALNQYQAAKRIAALEEIKNG